MITMMLLLLAGVDQDEIAADYELSFRAVNEHFKTLADPNPLQTPRSEAELRQALADRTGALR